MTEYCLGISYLGLLLFFFFVVVVVVFVVVFSCSEISAYFGTHSSSDPQGEPEFQATPGAASREEGISMGESLQQS